MKRNLRNWWLVFRKCLSMIKKPYDRRGGKREWPLLSIQPPHADSAER
jgi:hypothetical protein